MSKNYIMSDIHFGHANIRKYCPWSRGHFETVDDMNEAIIANHNSKVSEEDHTFIIGDFAFCKPDKAMEFMKRMNGTKTLIHGNHDRSLLKSHEFQNRSIRDMAGLIEDTPYKVISHKKDGVNTGVVLFHFRIATWDGMHHGSIHLHGHSHSAPEDRFQTNGRCMDIGLDGNNLYPYELDEVVSILKERPVTFDGHHDGSRE